MTATITSEQVPGHPEYRHLTTIAGIRIDLRYATRDNFVGRDLYSPLDCAWLHAEAAAAIERAVAWLAQRRPGCTLVILDALRPHRVQEQLWDALAGTNLRIYLADPARGSIHSYGMAVDVTIDGEDGRELDMGTGFDDMTELSHPALERQMLAEGRLTREQHANRLLLREAMTQAGFVGINSEWWHFDCGNRDEVRARYMRVL
ncbi:D-alanyl-D-alanine dipeptidase [Pseudoduganella flava]|uniref:D-alanyl-D-alanine dipeptidase n=1 Tax=Pseudoduganella flava TaxID=871742 RepID=A0A562PG68_9BURK|nr:M15 family metallopeptidase [Pseudoduganella flava]QGZ40287.1 D-alanyl-D-alanine dipeptidase [Pseudoduganella flava]TWI43472.1 D-alanyl-D-alanine dipeptidase [Pseudoduganella flava]